MYIIFDLDETVLNYERKIDDVTLACLHYFQNKGHKLVINTARSLINTNELIGIIKPDYSILFGGSLIVDKNKNIIFKSIIEKEKLNNIIKELKNCCKALSVETLDKLYCDKKDYKGEYFNFDEQFNFDAYKLLICSTDIPLINNLKEKYDLNLVTYHSLIWHRFVNKDVSKFLGIKKLMEINNDDLSSCIAFGDDFGDIEMINGCKVGVCMENAKIEVKNQIKGFIFGNNNDFGVAKFLLKYFKE